MNNFQKRIENSIRKGSKHTGFNVFEEILFSLVKKTSLSASDICDMPTPMVLNIHSKLFDYYEKKNKKRK